MCFTRKSKTAFGMWAWRVCEARETKLPECIQSPGVEKLARGALSNRRKKCLPTRGGGRTPGGERKKGAGQGCVSVGGCDFYTDLL